MEPQSGIVLGLFVVLDLTAGDTLVVKVHGRHQLKLKLLLVFSAVINEVRVILAEVEVELLLDLVEVPASLQVIQVPSIARPFNPRVLPVIIEPILQLGCIFLQLGLYESKSIFQSSLELIGLKVFVDLVPCCQEVYLDLAVLANAPSIASGKARCIVLFLVFILFKLLGELLFSLGEKFVEVALIKSEVEAVQWLSNVLVFRVGLR